MTNEQIWKLACQQTILNVSAMALSKSKEKVDPETKEDIILRSAYSYVGEEILTSFNIPKIPKELK